MPLGLLPDNRSLWQSLWEINLNCPHLRAGGRAGSSTGRKSTAFPACSTPGLHGKPGKSLKGWRADSVKNNCIWGWVRAKERGPKLGTVLETADPNRCPCEGSQGCVDVAAGVEGHRWHSPSFHNQLYSALSTLQATGNPDDLFYFGIFFFCSVLFSQQGRRKTWARFRIFLKVSCSWTWEILFYFYIEKFHNRSWRFPRSSFPKMPLNQPIYICEEEH